ncbi:phenylacetate--CoA ligase family protein [Clostridium senegalense]
MLVDLAKHGRELYKHNSLSREEILRYSEENFRKILKYAYKNSDFYKKLYLSKGIMYKDLDDILIKDIPIITKQQIRENFYDISVKRIDKKEIDKILASEKLLLRIKDRYIVHTSGTTGIPTNFIYDKRALRMLSANFIRLTMRGGNVKLGLSDIPLKNLYIAPVGGGYACTALALFGMEEYKCKSRIINAQKPLNQWIDLIRNYNPNYLSGYPSCLNLVAELKEQGKINITPKKIITGGEPLTRECIEIYKKVFGADIIDYYGCTESIFIGARSNNEKRMYLYDDLNYVEIDDENHLIITPLYNKAFPLIRYRLSDVVYGFNKEGDGDLPYTYIRKIMGRNEEIMWFVNERGKRDFLHPLFLDDLNVRGISKYQFVQKSLNYFELRCIYESIGNRQLKKEELEYQLHAFLKEKNLENVKYNIRFVEHLQVSQNTGKSKLVIKEI